MRIPGLLFARAMVFVVALFAAVVLPACSVNVKNDEKDEGKRVDIQTPVGGIHVSEDADVRDTGLPVYPGARLKEKEKEGDSKRANVNISGPGFGVKVVALEYVSGDSPQKLVDYYKDQLKKYGAVLECHTSKHEGDIETGVSHDSDGKSESKQLTCDKGDGGNTVELKAGTKDEQHIVAVEPDGKGSSFALVYVRARGKHDMI
jgi:hypothetical protein